MRFTRDIFILRLRESKTKARKDRISLDFNRIFMFRPVIFKLERIED
jgi:hypothetical protein